MMLAKPALAALGLVAVLGIVVPLNFIPQADAATAPCRTCGGGGGGSSSTPPDDGGNGGGGGNGGDLPLPPVEEQIRQMEKTCNGALNQLPKVPEKLVVAFDNPDGVVIVPFCDHGLGGRIAVDADQALPLQNAIAGNLALMSALAARGYRAEDVVGIIVTNGLATLYVHRLAHA
jgi:hypothetical protein